MSETYGSIDYQRLARAVGRANKQERITVDLAVAHAGFPIPASLLASGGQAVTILDAGIGVWALTFIYQDGSTATYLSTEITTGDIVSCDFAYLYVANVAQPGLTLTIVVDSRIIVGVEGY